MTKLLVVVLCYAVLSHSVVPDSFEIPWNAARQAPLSIGILQAKVLEWVALPFSRRSSQPRDQTQVSCIACRFFTYSHQGSPVEMLCDFPISVAFSLTALCA